MFSVPSYSVHKLLTSAVDAIAGDGYDLVYYNTERYRPTGDHLFRFIAYPASSNVYDTNEIGEDTTYFQFGELLFNSAAGLMDFLLAEVEREQPDIIFHSHLSVWGKLIARYFGLPSVTFNSTIVLDQRIMLPFFRKIHGEQATGVNNVKDAIGLLRKGRELYVKLGFKGVPDIWDAYVNKGDLNVCLLPEVLQPQREILGDEYIFTGCPFYQRREAVDKKLIYVAMGTILNQDIPLYRICVKVLEGIGIPCVISVGNNVNIGELGCVADHITIVPFADQPEMLRHSILFITRGGMASMQEAIQALTPMIVIPIIPEQQLNAERIAALGLGTHLSASGLTPHGLTAAISDMLENGDRYMNRLIQVAGTMEPLRAWENMLQRLDELLTPKTVLDLFVRQARARPDAVALCAGEACISYGELDALTGRLSAVLIEKGVKRGAIVPVFMEHGMGILIAILGIMRSGGAYVPIDAGYPDERVAYMLEDTSCKVVVSTAMCSGRLPATITPVLLDEHRDPIGIRPAMPAGCLPGPCDPAYIIYTSGSTGRPKGVVVEHAQIYQYLLDVHDNMELNECDSYAMLGTFSADAGLTAVFSALCFGKRLHLVDTKGFADPETLKGYFRKHSIDCYKITPSLLGILLQEPGMEVILPGKRLILGGEACPWKLARQVRRMLPEGCALYNHYGPTETTVGVITYRLPGEVHDLPEVIPLGKPLRHVGIYIFNEHMQEVAKGESGELYIGGALLARGYLNRPDLTAQRFVVHQAGGKEVRLYKTGDLVRMLPDENVEYLGRMDDQVKIRGYRIELKEIEHAIAASGMVNGCVVLARDNEAGIKYLAAYILPGEGYEKEALVKMLKRKLPGYMIPGRWVALREWPLTFNNKIDRQALPDAIRRGRGPVEPSAENHTVLIGIWRRLLGLDEVGIHEDLFELGGDSLLMIKLAFEINRVFGVKISVMELYEYLTIDRLAGVIAEKGRDGSMESDPEPEGFDSREASAAQRNFFLQKRLHPSESFPNSSITFNISGEIDMVRLQNALTKVIELHESLRLAFFLAGGKVYKRVEEKLFCELEFIHAGGNDVDREINRATRPFDFGKPPLIRAFIIQLNNGERYFHIDMPHINSDGESMKVIIDDLAMLYNDNGEGMRHLQFTDFQRHMHIYMHSRQHAADAAFWQAQLSGEDTLLNFHRAGRRQERFAGAAAVVTCPLQLSRRLEEYAREKGVTRFQILLIIYYLLLYKMTDQAELTVMVPVHGRNENGFEGIVGLLANVMPVRVQIGAEWTLADMISNCKAVILATARHQQLPFEKMLEIRARDKRDVKGLMQSFFGWHSNKDAYSFGDALLRLHIPMRDKESLPLSAAIFETGTGLTIRFSSLTSVFEKPALSVIVQQYLQLLEHVMSGDESTPLRIIVKGELTSSFY